MQQSWLQILESIMAMHVGVPEVSYEASPLHTPLPVDPELGDSTVWKSLLLKHSQDAQVLGGRSDGYKLSAVYLSFTGWELLSPITS